MSELRVIRPMKHKPENAAMIRRVVARWEKRRKMDEDELHVLLYLTDLARRIDDAFREPAPPVA